MSFSHPQRLFLRLYAMARGLRRRGTTPGPRRQPARGEPAPTVSVQELASAVVHSWRNPLASIRALAELALEEGRLEEVRV